MGSELHPLTALIRKLEMHTILADEDRERLFALPFTIKTLGAGSYLVREGEAPGTCALLLSGFAYRHKMAQTGERQIVSIHMPGDLLDLQHLFLDATDHNIQVLTVVHIAALPGSALRILFRMCPNIAQAIMTECLIEASMYREWTLNVGRRTGRAKVAHLLCEFAIRLDRQGFAEGQDYEVPMSQDQMSDALGMTPVHVSRMLKSLEDDGLLERHRRHVSFPQWSSLRKVAGFDNRYLHMDQRERRPALLPTAFASSARPRVGNGAQDPEEPQHEQPSG